MAVLFVRHEVEDYDAWRKGYDEAGEFQKANGVRSEAVYRHADEPNVVTVYHEFDSVDAAKEFAGNDELKDVMHDLGVKGKPDIWIANED